MDTRYAMAMKHGAPAPAPADWFDQLSSIPGVTVLGHTPRGAEFTATPQALTQVHAVFSPHFVIEEVSDRSSS
jgi:hypothetical protein